jgi:hypothetical protein
MWTKKKVKRHESSLLHALTLDGSERVVHRGGIACLPWPSGPSGETTKTPSGKLKRRKAGGTTDRRAFLPPHDHPKGSFGSRSLRSYYLLSPPDQDVVLLPESASGQRVRRGTTTSEAEFLTEMPSNFSLQWTMLYHGGHDRERLACKRITVSTIKPTGSKHMLMFITSVAAKRNCTQRPHCMFT